MMGEDGAPGVMPIAVKELFDSAAKDDEHDWRFGVTYVEIYNERVKDLLNPEAAELEVREDARKGTHIQGAVEVAVGTVQELMEHMERGSLYRVTEATNCNAVSSRSHAVLQVSVEALQKFGDGGGRIKRLSKLSMIDLAGSERAYKTDNTGQRLVEGRNINRSLLSLANCINALADKTKKGQHVPYRDSKLTRLLRDSLSGTSVSAMICAVSPASDQFEETLNTLKYANRAKQMKPPEVAQKNEVVHNPAAEQVEVLSELKETLVKLAADVSQKSSPSRAGGSSAAARPRERARRRRQVRSRRAAAASGGSGVGERLPASVAPGGAPKLDRSMSEVRKALTDLVETEPEARRNPAVRSAYQALDNMEAEEVEAISAEAALLWREQQALLQEMAEVQHEVKLLSIAIAWREAAGAGQGVGNDEAGGIANLRAQQTAKQASLTKMRSELTTARASLAQLQEEIPSRVVSSQRLSLLRLSMKQQHAATDALRFKQQARSKVALVQRLVHTWHEAIPPRLRELLLNLFDLTLVGAPMAPSLQSSPAVSSPLERQSSREAMKREAASAVGGGVEEEDDDDDDDEAARPFLLDGRGTATPWRTLGGLAMRAAMDGSGSGKAARATRAGGGDDAQSPRGAQGGALAAPRGGRFVEEATSPDVRARRPVGRHRRHRRRSSAPPSRPLPRPARSPPPPPRAPPPSRRRRRCTCTALPRRRPPPRRRRRGRGRRPKGRQRRRRGVGRARRRRGGATAGRPPEVAAGSRFGAGGAAAVEAASPSNRRPKLTKSMPLLPSADVDDGIQVLPSTDDPLMQSFHPMLPGWMDGDSAGGVGGGGGGGDRRQRALDARAIQEALKAGAAAARHGDRPPPPRHRPAPSAASAGRGARRGARAAPRCRRTRLGRGSPSR